MIPKLTNSAIWRRDCIDSIRPRRQNSYRYCKAAQIDIYRFLPSGMDVRHRQESRYTAHRAWREWLGPLAVQSDFAPRLDRDVCCFGVLSCELSIPTPKSGIASADIRERRTCGPTFVKEDLRMTTRCSTCGHLFSTMFWSAMSAKLHSPLAGLLSFTSLKCEWHPS